MFSSEKHRWHRSNSTVKLLAECVENSEQKHFSEATREMQLYYNRLFAERSEHILSGTNQALQKEKNTVGASAQRCRCKATRLKNVQS